MCVRACVCVCACVRAMCVLVNILPLITEAERCRLKEGLPPYGCQLSDMLRLATVSQAVAPERRGWTATHVSGRSRMGVDELLRLRRGLCLVEGNAHCVSIDAGNRRVYDGSVVAPFNLTALEAAGVTGANGLGAVRVAYAKSK